MKKTSIIFIFLILTSNSFSFQAAIPNTSPHAIKGCLYINGTIAAENIPIKLFFPHETLQTTTFPLDDNYNYNIGFYDHEGQTCTFQIYYNNSWHIPTNNPTIKINGEQTIYYQNLYIGRIPEAKLSCNGSFTHSRVIPFKQINGHFTIQNTGDKHTSLSWEISSWPSFGTWNFQYPPGKDHITPEDGPIRINITAHMTFSNIIYNLFHPQKTGEIHIINTENTTDHESIPVTITMFFRASKTLLPPNSDTFFDRRIPLVSI